MASLDLWCSFFALVLCGFFGVICGNLTRGNSPISLVFGLDIGYLVFGICLESPTWIGNRNSLLFVICEP